jgi:integrase
MASINKRVTTRTIVDASGKKRAVTTTRHRARYRDEAGNEHMRHFARKVDAQDWLDEQTAGLVRGDWVDPRHGKITFDEWFADWSARQVWADGTLEAARQAAASVTFGAVPVRLILRSHVETWVKQMSTTLAASTTRMRYNYVHMGLRAAVRDKIIREAPSDGVALPKVARAEVTMLIPTPEQVATARVSCPDATFVGFVGLCAYAGLRLGEAAGLQVGDVDFLRREIQVRRQVQGQTRSTTKIVPPKAGSARTISVSDELIELLSVQASYAWGHEGWLFGVGELLNRNSAGHLWRQTREAVSMQGFTLHDLRHFYASGLIAAGCDVVTVQHALGHSTPTITLDTYSHLWPKADDRTRAAAASLWRSAGSLRAEGAPQAGDLHVQR